MTDLIAKVRVLINDRTIGKLIFTDQDIQDALDDGIRRRDVYHCPLVYVNTMQFGGAIAYLDYWASEGGFWESDWTLNDALGVSLAPLAVEELAGHWHFGAHQNPPVYLTGKQYDVYNVAADLLETWAARLKTHYDFLSLGRTLKRSQQGGLFSALIDRYRRRGWLNTMRMERTDEWPDYPDATTAETDGYA